MGGAGESRTAPGADAELPPVIQLPDRSDRRPESQAERTSSSAHDESEARAPRSGSSPSAQRPGRPDGDAEIPMPEPPPPWEDDPYGDYDDSQPAGEVTDGPGMVGVPLVAKMLGGVVIDEIVEDGSR